MIVEAFQVSAANAMRATDVEMQDANGRKPRRARPGRDAQLIEVCDCVIDLAAAIFSLPSTELRRSGRCTDQISRVRQIAMYVTHVVLGLTMAEIGKGFGQDRTTVVHACHLIEDLRDDEDFDHVISRTEHIIAAAFRSRLPA